MMVGSKPLSIAYSAEGGRVHKHLTVGGRTITSSRVCPIEDDIPAAWAKGYLLGASLRQNASPTSVVRSAELFCGSGGLGLGVRESVRELGLKYTSVACLDHDPEAVEVYAANHESQVRSACSVTEIIDYNVSGTGDDASYLYEPEILDERWANLSGEVDLLMAGPPCQGHSNLNNRTRRNDKRNQLYLAVPSIGIALNAGAIVIENVEAVVHDRSGVVNTTIALLEKAGYLIETGSVSALSLGWPQTRKRYFLVATKNRSPLALQSVLDAVEAEQRTLEWAIGDLVGVPVDNALDVPVELSEENQRRINYLFDNDLLDLPYSERPECHQGGTTYNSVYGRLRLDRPAPTITTGFLTPGRGRFIHPTERRTITPHEAARIQGFPDSYNFSPDPNKPASRSKLTKWIGDAVPMPLGYVAGLSALGTL